MLPIGDRFFELLQDVGIFDPSKKEIYEQYREMILNAETYASGPELSANFLDNIGKLSTAINDPNAGFLDNAEAVVGMLGVLQGVAELTLDVTADPKNSKLVEGIAKKIPGLGAVLTGFSLTIDLSSIIVAYNDPDESPKTSDYIGVVSDVAGLAGFLLGAGAIVVGGGAMTLLAPALLVASVGLGIAAAVVSIQEQVEESLNDEDFDSIGVPANDPVIIPDPTQEDPIQNPQPIEQPPEQPPVEPPVQPTEQPPAQPPVQPTDPNDGPNPDDFLPPDLTPDEPVTVDRDLNENGVPDSSEVINAHLNDEGEVVLENLDGSETETGRKLQEGETLHVNKETGEVKITNQDGDIETLHEGENNSSESEFPDIEDLPEQNEHDIPNIDDLPVQEDQEEDQEQGGEQGGEGGGAGDPAGKGSGGSGRSIPRDPLVLDLDGDGVELTQLEGSEAYFDLNGDGFATRTSWLSGDDGFLAMDRNLDGVINNISELFGSPERTGYEELSDLDSNLDGYIDSGDENFSKLKLWQDKNGDGVSQAAEMQSLSDAGILSVSLNYQDVALQPGADGQIARQGTFTWADGTQGLAAETTGIAADVLFSSNPTYTRYVGSVPIDPDVLAVGNIKGYGQMPDLHQAMSLNENLKSYVLQLFAAPSADTLLASFEELLVKWANVEGITLDEIDPGHRINLNPETGLVDFRLAGESFTPEQLGVVKKYAGMDALQLGDGQWRENGKIVTTGSFYREAYQQLSRNLLIKLAVANGLVEDVALNISYDSQSDLLSLGTAPSAGLFTSMLSDMEANKNDAPFVAKHWISLAALLEVKPSISTELSDAINSFVIDHADIESLKAIFENSMFDLLALDSFIGTSDNDSIIGSTVNDLLVGFSGKDVLNGWGGDDRLLGGEGDDTLTGESGNDFLDGGSGNDQLLGGWGNDVYVFGKGDGQDIIHGFSDTSTEKLNVLRFKEGVDPSEVVAKRIADFGYDSLELSIAGTDDKIVARYFFSGSDVTNRYNPIQQVEFADGTVWDSNDVVARVFAGTDASDTITCKITWHVYAMAVAYSSSLTVLAPCAAATA